MQLYFLIEGKKFLMLLKVEYCQKERLTSILDKIFNHKQLKILTSTQMLQRLPIALAQVKAGNKSENLQIEIMQIIYSLYQEKKVT